MSFFYGQKRKTNKALFLTNMKDGKIKALTNERELLDMSRKLTNEEIVQKIYDLVGDEYTKLDDTYINSQTKFKIKHNVCDFEYEIAWNTFQQGSRCPKCSGLMKLTNEDIKERIFKLVGDEYELLSGYVNKRTKFKIRHNTCGHQYKTTWDNFQQGSRCPKCSSRYRCTDSEITQQIFSMTNGEYTKLSIYENAKTKFKIKHNICGHQYEIAWDTFQRGVRCPKCAGRYRYTDSEISELIADMTNGEYTKLSEYKDSKTKFKIRHEKCNFEYEVHWNNFRQGNRCPKCNQSKGEKFIEDLLTNQGVSFATQVRFDDCRHKLPLPFDFGILNSDGEVVALLEFDGQQHFEPIEAWGGEENLKEVQLRDRIKDSYCKEHKIPLLRIRYDEQNMLKVIEEFLNENIA